MLPLPRSCRFAPSFVLKKHVFRIDRTINAKLDSCFLSGHIGKQIFPDNSRHPRLYLPGLQCRASGGLWENDRELQQFGCSWDCSSDMLSQKLYYCVPHSLAAYPVFKEKPINHFSVSQVVQISRSLQASVNTHPFPNTTPDTHPPAFSPCFPSCCGARQQGVCSRVK